MSTIIKERIYEELRHYHEEQFPNDMASERMGQMRTVFAETEDRVVTMLLRLVSGKEEFVDSTKELKMFQDRITSMPANPVEEGNRTVFTSKINKLIAIVSLAGDSNFQLRKFKTRAV